MADDKKIIFSMVGLNKTIQMNRQAVWIWKIQRSL